MRIKSIASALAVTAAMLVSGSAFALTTINGTELSAEELPFVQQRCDALAAEGTGGQTAAETQTNTEGTTDTGVINDAENTKDPVDAAAQALSKIDLEALTLDACVAAGLSPAM